jgi:beta-N-acetylhexosaminidase
MFYFLLFLCLPLYGELSLQDKVGQVFMAPIYERELSEGGRDFLRETRLGNVIYFDFANGPFSKEQIGKLSQDLREAIVAYCGIPPLLAIDQEGIGFNQLKGGFSCFTSMGKEQALQLGLELHEVGVTTDLAPVVDVVVRPDCPLSYRSFGSDPGQVIACARQIIEGLHERGVHAVLKHFPGLGDTLVDSHLGLPVLHKTLEEMEALELRPYFALSGEADAIMAAHLMVPSVDPNRCASLSKAWVTDVLRARIGFNKVVMTDSLVMKGVLGEVHSFDEAVDRLTQAAIGAFLAGSDLLLLARLEWANFPVTREQNIKLIAKVMAGFRKAVERGTISEERLNESLVRILRMKNS